MPVTQRMLYDVRDQLVTQMKAMVHGSKKEFHGFKSDIHGLKSEFQGLKSDMHGLKSEMHRVALLVEEQNARNRIVLDGLASLFERQDRVEAKVDALQK